MGISQNESLSVPAGTSFNLKCGARGYPEPDIKWYIDDKTIKNEKEGFSTGLCISTNVFSCTSRYIQPVNCLDEDGTLYADAAPYKTQIIKCIASNGAGSDEVEYVVNTISHFISVLIIRKHQYNTCLKKSISFSFIKSHF